MFCIYMASKLDPDCIVEAAIPIHILATIATRKLADS